ncbi:MAG: GIY-YIG nuclease family protein [Patescibacteria group bacterium]|nr:GIY-YIG nuclease family protein [Patescibacteria group bacterium]
MFYVYILQSKKDGKKYIGFNSDLKERIKQHKSGEVRATKNRLPLALVYYEAFSDKKAAQQQELFYKTGQGRRILNKRLFFVNKI